MEKMRERIEELEEKIAFMERVASESDNKTADAAEEKT